MFGLRTSYQRKSFLLTIILMGLLVMSLFYFGMQYLDPPKEYGVAVKFGLQDYGGSSETKIQAPENNPEPQIPQPESNKPAPVSPTENLISDENADVDISSKEKEDVKAKQDALEKQLKEEEERRKREEIDALMNGLNGPSQANQGKEKVDGTKGKENGDPNAEEYYSSGGSDSDGNYKLDGRKVLKKPIYDANCEEGIIVLRISVDQNGNVIEAEPIIKGSTSQAPCLIEPAKRAAMETKFDVDKDAPEVQVGQITYVFKVRIN